MSSRMNAVPSERALRHGRLGRHAAVDRLLLHRGDEGLAGTDATTGLLGGVDAVLLAEVLGEEVGRGAGVGDAERAALEVGRALDLALEVAAAQLDLAGDLEHRDDGLGGLALRLEGDVVVVEAADALDLAGEHVLRGVAAGGLVDEVDVDAGLVVVAELLGEHEGQVDLLAHAADHDRHGRARLACGPLAAPAPAAPRGAGRVVGTGGHRGGGEEGRACGADALGVHELSFESGAW